MARRGKSTKSLPDWPLGGGGGSQTEIYLHIFNDLITINCLGDFFPVR